MSACVKESVPGKKQKAMNFLNFLKKSSQDEKCLDKVGDLVSVRMTPGEVLDRLSILDIKRRKLYDEKQKKAEAQYLELKAISSHLFPFAKGHYESLVKINEGLWQTEDRVRQLLKQATDEKDAHELGFTGVAATVPILNDERARVKNEFDALIGCSTTEIKGYV